MNTILRLIASGFAAAFLVLTAQAADLAPGMFTAGTVAGDVTFKTASSENTALTAGTSLPQGAIIKTGADSKVSIVFSNGSLAVITANSEIEITKFEQELFTGPIKVGVEPSVSNTEIRVINGSVFCNVVKLRKGSAYTVNSPLGATSVLGTSFIVSSENGVEKISVFSGRITVKYVSEGVVKEAVVDAGKTLSAENLQAGLAAQGIDISAVTNVVVADSKPEETAFMKQLQDAINNLSAASGIEPPSVNFISVDPSELTPVSPN